MMGATVKSGIPHWIHKRTGGWVEKFANKLSKCHLWKNSEEQPAREKYEGLVGMPNTGGYFFISKPVDSSFP